MEKHKIQDFFVLNSNRVNMQPDLVILKLKGSIRKENIEIHKPLEKGKELTKNILEVTASLGKDEYIFKRLMRYLHVSHA